MAKRPARGGEPGSDEPRGGESDGGEPRGRDRGGGLAGRHGATLRTVFETPTRADIAWRSIEALFEALGARVSDGKGSRVRVYLNGVVAVFHRPHPRKEASKGAVESVRGFLANAGVRP